MGLQTTVPKCLTEEPPFHPISAEKGNCSWPEVRNWKEADTNSHKSSRINILFLRGRYFFILVEDKGVVFFLITDTVFKSKINCDSVQT